jgi:hypothetical protein
MAMNTREGDENRSCTIAFFDRWVKLCDRFLCLFRLSRSNFHEIRGSLGPCARLLRSRDAHKGLNYTKFGSTETEGSAQGNDGEVVLRLRRIEFYVSRFTLRGR